MGWGSVKAKVIKQAAEEDDTEHVPASLLQNHDDVSFVVDEAAAAELTRNKSPWLTGRLRMDTCDDKKSGSEHGAEN